MKLESQKKSQKIQLGRKKRAHFYIWGAFLLLTLGSFVVIARGYDHFSGLFGFRKVVTTTPRGATPSKFVDRERRNITVGEHQLEVEVVSSSESTTQGLSGRESIGADGMLFVFPDKRVHSFWMPDMQFDLDIIWISDETVMGIVANVPMPTENQVLLPTYSSNVPVNRVLELPAGKAKELSIEPGTTLIY